MSEAGFGKTPIPVDLAVRVGWQPHEQAAVWIQRELEKIGFKVNIVKETDATFRQVASKGDHQLSIEILAVLDQRSVLSPVSSTSTARRQGHQHGVLFESGGRQADRRQHARDRRRPSAWPPPSRLQKILIDDAVWGLLWYDNWTRVMRSDLVGVEKRWDTFERYYNMKLA